MLCLPFFHGQNISFCYTTSRKLMFWFFFFFFFYRYLLFSQTRNLSTFFTVKMFRSVTAYAGIGCFSMSIFFMFVYFFHVLVPCLPIFTERVLRSLTPYGKNFTFRHVYVFQRLVPCLSFSRPEYFVLLHQRQEI